MPDHVFTVPFLHRGHPLGGLIGGFELIRAIPIIWLAQLASIAFNLLHPNRCLAHDDFSAGRNLGLLSYRRHFREKHRLLLRRQALQIYE